MSTIRADDDAAAAVPHLLIALLPDGQSEALVAHGQRLTRATRGRWTVVAIDTPLTEPRATAHRQAMQAALQRAEAAGAAVARLSIGTHAPSGIVSALVHRVRSERADGLLIGRPRLSGFIGSSEGLRLNHFADVLADLLPGVTVHVVVPASTAGRAAGEPAATRPDWRRLARTAVEVVLALVVATACAAGLQPWLQPAPLVMTYLAAVVLIASRHGQTAAVAAVVGGILLYDWVIVPPRWSLKPAEPQYFVVFALMGAIGLVVARLAARGREQAQTADARARRADALSRLAVALGGARSPQAILDALQQALTGAVGVSVRALAADDLPSCTDERDLDETARRFGVDVGLLRRLWSDGSSPSASAGDPAGSDDRWRLFTLGAEGDGGPLGLVAMPPPPADRDRLEDRQLVHAMLRQAAVALERARFEARSTASAIEVERERLRSTLLAAISHDFRTPLTTIVGNATTLRDQAEALDAAQRARLLGDLLGEARRLYRWTRDLLDLTRLEAGGVTPQLEWCPADELVAEAVDACRTMLAGRRLAVEVSPATLVWCDPRLLGRVLCNLLENAARHTPIGRAVRISITTTPERWRLTVHDQGPGLPPDEAASLFRPFHRGRSTAGDTGPDAGHGLGLAICAAVATLHGGAIAVSHDDGACFVMDVPWPPGERPSEVDLE